MSENFLTPATHLKLIVYKFDEYLILPMMQCSGYPNPIMSTGARDIFGYPTTRDTRPSPSGNKSVKTSEHNNTSPSKLSVKQCFKSKMTGAYNNQRSLSNE